MCGQSSCVLEQSCCPLASLCERTSLSSQNPYWSSLGEEQNHYLHQDSDYSFAIWRYNHTFYSRREANFPSGLPYSHPVLSKLSGPLGKLFCLVSLLSSLLTAEHGVTVVPTSWLVVRIKGYDACHSLAFGIWLSAQ
jgi:hypothetical protein